MNDVARDILVEAALKGVKQARGCFRDGNGSFCAMGVLYQKLADMDLGTWDEEGFDTWRADAVERTFGVTPLEQAAIVRANDVLNWDFLTIARKIGVNDGDPT